MLFVLLYFLYLFYTIIIYIMNYLTDIDPIGEGENENECNHCKNPCSGSYCSDACKIYDNE